MTVNDESGKPLRDFLVRVGNDPRLLLYWWGRPEELLDESGLSEEHKDILRKGDLTEIRRALIDEAGFEPEDAKWVLDSTGWVLIRI